MCKTSIDSTYRVEREYCEPYSHLTQAGKLLLTPLALNQFTSRYFYCILYITGVKVLCLSPASLWNNRFLFTQLNNAATIFSPYLYSFALLVTEKLQTSSTSPSELEQFDWNLLHFFFPRKGNSFTTVKKHVHFTGSYLKGRLSRNVKKKKLLKRQVIRMLILENLFVKLQDLLPRTLPCSLSPALTDRNA